VDVDKVVRSLLSSMYTNRVSMDGTYAELFANVLCLQRLVTDLDPSFNLFDASYALFRAHQILGDEHCQRVFSKLHAYAPWPFWTALYKYNLYSGRHGPPIRF
jgi:hypothetical protein